MVLAWPCGAKITRSLVRRSFEALREENRLELNHVVAFGNSKGIFVMGSLIFLFLGHQHSLFGLFKKFQILRRVYELTRTVAVGQKKLIINSSFKSFMLLSEKS